MIALLGDIWSSLINGIRTMDGTLRGFIVLGLLLLTFFFLALSINKGKNHMAKPMKWGFFVLSIICFGILIFFATVM